nr:hypothetical protein GCM10020093_101460 [Planobispora longispora]
MPGALESTSPAGRSEQRTVTPPTASPAWASSASAAFLRSPVSPGTATPAETSRVTSVPLATLLPACGQVRSTRPIGSRESARVTGPTASPARLTARNASDRPIPASEGTVTSARARGGFVAPGLPPSPPPPVSPPARVLPSGRVVLSGPGGEADGVAAPVPPGCVPVVVPAGERPGRRPARRRPGRGPALPPPARPR